MKIEIVCKTFDPWIEIQQFQQSAKHLQGNYGATSIFVGTMRDLNQGDDIKGMTLEHYPGMTEYQLEKVISTAMKQWSVIDVLLMHRVGNIFPNEPIVLVAVWSSHRGDAYDTNRFIMEALKSKAPFWKKELLESNEQRWVDKNTNGYKMNYSD